MPCLRVLGFQSVISLRLLGCVKTITPVEMARRPLHEPIRAILLLRGRSVGSRVKGSMLVVKGSLNGMIDFVSLGKWSW